MTRISLHLFLFLLSSITHFHVSGAADAIFFGQSLSGNQTLVSKRGHFELGFFSQPGNSQNYHIGIWYKKVSEQTIIWVANRESSMTNTSTSELKISGNGNLVLTDQSGLTAWSTNITKSTNTTSLVAVLLDSGNLVLRDALDSSVLFWQSFDHPSDTMLPGGWLSLNKVSGEYQNLVSWKNITDPMPGPFANRIDPYGSGNLVLMWNGTNTYWSAGKWNGHGFSAIPEMIPNSLCNFSYTEDDQQYRLMFELFNESVITRVTMNPYGQLTQWTWVESSQSWVLHWAMPNDQCDIYSFCGAYGICSTQNSRQYCSCLNGFEPSSPSDWWDSNVWSGGCKRRTRLLCPMEKNITNQDRDGFMMLQNVRLPDNPQLLAAENGGECELACLNNCSCTAYAYASTCSIWLAEIRNIKQLSYGDIGAGVLHLRLAASELIPRSSKKTKTFYAIVLPAVLGLVAILCAAAALLFGYFRCQKRRLLHQQQVEDGSLIAFSYSYLRLVTKNFSEELGRGGFGSVFKAKLTDKTAMAVKRLKGSHGQGEKHFLSEVRTLGKIQHVNLVRLRGFCSKGDERLLVYDYMANGSLDSHLFGKVSKVLDWNTRFGVILGVAKGLGYLHEGCRERVIHCDIKPENILLDADFRPKVSDFGMAKLIGRDFSRVLTTMRGTIGYLAPEWISGLPITHKADVYSYGMMLLEIVSGRRNKEAMKHDNVAFFPVWAAMRIHVGNADGLLDERLNGEADMEELNRVCTVACWCIQDSEDHRPSMGQVIQMLQGILDLGRPPIPSSLQQLAEDQNSSALSAIFILPSVELANESSSPI